ncbi:hypothetical protein CK203_087338 [Vitis vinifera]|uniref:DUF659 domain-containing protein n=1 Tax=Vitis vinifera TaxID=29760 RepID=A0A438BM78_VITVI|nr:hypothetical protein CK203_087338 [Vitis vinifera]
MGRRHRHVIDEDDEENLGGDGGDDDDDGDDDVYMYLVDMHPDERHAYREAVRASKAAEWNQQQEEHFIKGKRKTGESSHPTNPTTRQMRKSQSVRYSDLSLPDAPSLYKSSAARQKTVKNLFKGGAIKETMGRLISKFFIYESVPPSKADSHHFKNMIVGIGIEPPSPYEIKHKYLDMEYKDMEAYEVGKQNVVQIVTDNGSAFVKAGKLLMKKYNLYWTPCAAHCIDLMFEDHAEGVWWRHSSSSSNKICNQLYSPRESFEKKANLKKVFISDEWAQHNLSRTLIGKEVESLMFDHAYWERVGKLVSIYEALYTVLRIVDSEVVPTMPFIVRIELLNILFMQQISYKRGVGTDPDLLQVVHEVFAKLDPTSEGLSQFGNEIIIFRDAKKGFGDRAAIASRS